MAISPWALLPLSVVMMFVASCCQLEVWRIWRGSSVICTDPCSAVVLSPGSSSTRRRSRQRHWVYNCSLALLRPLWSSMGIWKLGFTPSQTLENSWKLCRATGLIRGHQISRWPGQQDQHRHFLQTRPSAWFMRSSVDRPSMQIVDSILFRFSGSWLPWASSGTISIWDCCRILTLDLRRSSIVFANIGWSLLVLQPPRWSQKPRPSSSSRETTVVTWLVALSSGTPFPATLAAPCGIPSCCVMLLPDFVGVKFHVHCCHWTGTPKKV